jgi:hypothetical protein
MLNLIKQFSISDWLKEPVAEISGAPTFGENDEFSEILTYKRAKYSLFECKWGGGLPEILKVLSEI